MWVTRGQSHVQHIFFDDNIFNDRNHSIVAVRRRNAPGEPFAPLGAEETLALHGKHLVRVPTLEVALDKEFFLKKIAECEEVFSNACAAAAPQSQ